MIGKKMCDALNAQVNAELYSAYLYLSMSAYFSSVNLPGFANWMKAQALEEQYHAAKIYDFVIERGGNVILKAIDEPPAKWDSPSAAFGDVLTHEKKVTGLINGLMDIAVKEKDHATQIFLQWFVTEQIEEEAGADEIVGRLEMIGKDGGALMMLDRELATRQFVLPPDVKVVGGTGAA